MTCDCDRCTETLASLLPPQKRLVSTGVWGDVHLPSLSWTWLTVEASIASAEVI